MVRRSAVLTWSARSMVHMRLWVKLPGWAPPGWPQCHRTWRAVSGVMRDLLTGSPCGSGAGPPRAGGLGRAVAAAAAWRGGSEVLGDLGSDAFDEGAAHVVGHVGPD